MPPQYGSNADAEGQYCCAFDSCLRLFLLRLRQIWQVHGQKPPPQMGVLHHGAHDARALVATEETRPQLAAGAIAGEQEALAATVVAPEVLAVLWRVQEEFLNAALHMVDNDFGGVQAYLVDVLGVDAAAQKELVQRYLQAL
ncbi:tyrosine-protein phosphatase [Acidovorax sp.]|uniref:tyrosine-protein phosphatase n=1 Tax=Acidovorax sp. TaxID=1872122 RepID=UPI003BB1C8D1